MATSANDGLTDQIVIRLQELLQQIERVANTIEQIWSQLRSFVLDRVNAYRSQQRK